MAKYNSFSCFKRSKVNTGTSDSIKERIYAAARDGEDEVICNLLSPLKKAEVVKILKHVTCNVDTGIKMTPLLVAAQHGHNGVVRMLVKRFKVKVDQLGTVKTQTFMAFSNNFVCENATALWCACEAGHVGTVKVLLELGADANHAANRSTSDRPGGTVVKHTCLLVGIWNGQTDVISCLLENGADPNLTDNEGITPINRVYASKNQLEIVQILVQHGADWKKSIRHFSILDRAAYYRKAAVVELLTSQPNCTKSMKVSAYELMGAMSAENITPNALQLERLTGCLMSYSARYNTADCYKYLMVAMKERFSGTSVLQKTVLPPMKAYGGRVECQTIVELESLEHNEDALHFEALMVFERHLTEDPSCGYPGYSDYIWRRGFALSKEGRFEDFVSLSMHYIDVICKHELFFVKGKLYKSSADVQNSMADHDFFTGLLMCVVDAIAAGQVVKFDDLAHLFQKCLNFCHSRNCLYSVLTPLALELEMLKCQRLCNFSLIYHLELLL